MENFIFCAVKTSSPLLPLTKTITAYQYIPQHNLGNYCTRSNEVLQNLRIYKNIETSQKLITIQK